MNTEERRALASAGGQARDLALSPERKKEIARQAAAARNAKLTPEQRRQASEAGRRAAIAARKRKAAQKRIDQIKNNREPQAE